MDIVFANDTRVVGHPTTGGAVGIAIGTHWPADDPVVVAYPTLFTNDPRFGLSSSRPFGEDGYPVVEQATAAPGERRTRSQRIKADGE